MSDSVASTLRQQAALRRELAAVIYEAWWAADVEGRNVPLAAADAVLAVPGVVRALTTQAALDAEQVTAYDPKRQIDDSMDVASYWIAIGHNALLTRLRAAGEEQTP